MKNIIVSTLLVLVVSTLFVFALSYGMDKNEQVECHKWQGYAYELKGFYLTSSQAEQCAHWNIQVDAPVKNY